MLPGKTLRTSLTAVKARNYIANMSQHDAITQADASLTALQHKLERMLDQYQTLVQAYTELRERHDALMQERTNLISNNEQAKHRVEAMLTRLKDLEPRV